MTRRRPPLPQAGFTLVELLLAVLLGGVVLLAASEGLISQLRSAERSEASERQRSDWSRAVQFIEAEVALSEQVIVEAANVAIPSACGITASQFRVALDLRRDLPPVIYGVEESAAGWLGSHTLVRCGPPINADGSFSPGAAAVRARLLDGLDGSAAGNGFLAVLPDTSERKALRYTLALRGLASTTFRQAAEAQTRVNPLYPRPGEGSLCEAGNLVVLAGGAGPDSITVPISAVPAGQDVLVCGRGGGDTLTGSSGNDILEASPAGESASGGGGNGATLRGNEGNDHLRGTTDADRLEGGCGDDVLVGRGGADLLSGGPASGCSSDRNLHLPGPGSSTISGGAGLDVVFFNGPISAFSRSGCSRSACSVSGSGQQVSMTGVEVLIFKDGRVDLED